MENQPLVSVLMTAYNREKYIAEAIESVLASTYVNFELIIVDDGSKDATVSIANAYLQKDSRIKLYLNEKNLGDYPNRNKAAGYAHGKYLKYVDSDDMIYSYTLMTMVTLMEKFPDSAIGISSRSEAVVTYMKPADSYNTHFFRRGLLDCGPTAIIIRKEIFNKVGLFKEIRNVSDYDMWLRIAARYPILEMQKDLVLWREHEEQEIRLGEFAYVEHQLPILMEHLTSNNCPLTPDQQAFLIEKYRKIFAIRLLKRILRGKDILACIRIWRLNRLSLLNLV